MSDGKSGANLPEAQRDPLVEATLNLLFPFKPFLEGLQGALEVITEKRGVQTAQTQEIDAKRAELQLLPHPDLQRLHDSLVARKRETDQALEVVRRNEAQAKAAAAERERFYNQPQAQANFAFSLKADFWTFDDSIALLLGKDPRAVTWQAVQRELNPPRVLMAPKPEPGQFLRNYVTLRNLAQRSEVMTASPKLRPADVVRWAVSRLQINVPEPLLVLLEPAALSGPRPEAINPGLDTSATKIVHRLTKGERRDALAPVIEAAQAKCPDPFDAAAVWGRLLVFAQAKEPPLIGCTEEGIQYLRDGEAAILTRDALGKRLGRAKKRS